MVDPCAAAALLAPREAPAHNGNYRKPYAAALPATIPMFSGTWKKVATPGAAQRATASGVRSGRKTRGDRGDVIQQLLAAGGR